MTDPSSFESLMHELQQDYFAALPKKIESLEMAFEREDWSQLELEFHNLKGTGKTYGVPEISQLCAPLELAFRKRLSIPETLFSQALQCLIHIKEGYESGKNVNIDGQFDFQQLEALEKIKPQEG